MCSDALFNASLQERTEGASSKSSGVSSTTQAPAFPGAPQQPSQPMPSTIVTSGERFCHHLQTLSSHALAGGCSAQLCRIRRLSSSFPVLHATKWARAWFAEHAGASAQREQADLGSAAG